MVRCKGFMWPEVGCVPQLGCRHWGSGSLPLPSTLLCFLQVSAGHWELFVPSSHPSFVRSWHCNFIINFIVGTVQWQYHSGFLCILDHCSISSDAYDSQLSSVDPEIGDRMVATVFPGTTSLSATGQSHRGREQHLPGWASDRKNSLGICSNSIHILHSI